MSSQYRKPVDFSKKTMDNARNSYKRLKNIISEIKDDKKTNKEYLEKFKKVMDDDLNTPKALQVLWNLVRDKKAKGKYQTIKKMDEVFGFDLLKKEKIEIPKKVKELVREREKIRKEKNWEEADKIREKIKKLGYSLDDTKDGIVVRKLKKY